MGKWSSRRLPGVRSAPVLPGRVRWWREQCSGRRAFTRCVRARGLDEGGAQPSADLFHWLLFASGKPCPAPAAEQLLCRARSLSCRQQSVFKPPSRAVTVCAQSPPGSPPACGVEFRSRRPGPVHARKQAKPGAPSPPALRSLVRRYRVGNTVDDTAAICGPPEARSTGRCSDTAPRWPRLPKCYTRRPCGQRRSASRGDVRTRCPTGNPGSALTQQAKSIQPPRVAAGREQVGVDFRAIFTASAESRLPAA